LLRQDISEDAVLSDIVNSNLSAVFLNNNLRTAVEKMSNANIEVLPVITREDNNIIGLISYKDILKAYQSGREEYLQKNPNISLKNRSIKILLRGQKIVTIIRKKGKKQQ
jgi:predicted transcriptional regulator